MNNFEESWQREGDYPRNLCYQIHPAVAEKCAARLQQPGLFSASIDEITVIECRRFGPEGIRVKPAASRLIRSSQELRDWLRESPADDQLFRSNGVCPDPRLRFICLSPKHGRDSIRVTSASISAMFTYHQVLPEFAVFLNPFGNSLNAKGLRFSSFKSWVQRETVPGLDLDSLDRSGQFYQMCHVFSTAVRSGTPEQWSIEKAVFHHQCDLRTNTSLWIMIDANNDMKDVATEELRSLAESKAFNTPLIDSQSLPGELNTWVGLHMSFAMHIAFAQWCSAGWLEYIEWLESRFEVPIC